MKPNRLIKPKNPLYPGGSNGGAAAGIDVDAVLQFQDQFQLETAQVTGLDDALAAKAPLDSPALTGSPTAPTPAAGDDSDAIATTAWVTAHGGGGGGTRDTATVTTSSLAANATDATQAAPLGKSGTLFRVATDRPARVRLYATAAALVADASRMVGVDPVGESQVLLDLVTTADTLDYVLAPKVPYSNDESTPTANIALSVQNLDTITSTVTVTFTKITAET